MQTMTTKNMRPTNWDASYEWKAVLLLGLGFGLVSIDRFLIMPLFPVIMKDLNLDFQDLGLIAGALGMTWGLAAMFTGRLTDLFGHRQIIIPATIIFSLMVGLSGLATGLISLMMIRAAIGVAEGAYTPASIIATMEASKPTRHGLNVGLQQAAMPLLGLAVAPIFATQMLRFMNWHFVFSLVMIPGLIIAFLLFLVLRNTDATHAALHTATHDASNHVWTDVFKSRNVKINMINMLCWLTSLVGLSAFLPNYLTDYLGLGIEQMGFVLSAFGLGGAVGTVVMPTISDIIGRKPVMLISTLGGALSIYALTRTGPDPVMLYILLFLILFFTFALICLTVGPLSGESVPAQLMTTASGLVIGVGEVIGGGIIPAAAGYIAKHYGIQYVLYFPLATLCLGFLLSLGLRETLRKLEEAPSPVPAAVAG